MLRQCAIPAFDGLLLLTACASLSVPPTRASSFLGRYLLPQYFGIASEAPEGI